MTDSTPTETKRPDRQGAISASSRHRFRLGRAGLRDTGIRRLVGETDVVGETDAIRVRARTVPDGFGAIRGLIVRKREFTF